VNAPRKPEVRISELNVAGDLLHAIYVDEKFFIAFRGEVAPKLEVIFRYGARAARSFVSAEAALQNEALCLAVELALQVFNSEERPPYQVTTYASSPAPASSGDRGETWPVPKVPTSSRTFESGPGFVAAVPCPQCGHTKCGADCACDCASQSTSTPAWQQPSKPTPILDAAIAAVRGANSPLQGTWQCRECKLVVPKPFANVCVKCGPGTLRQLSGPAPASVSTALLERTQRTLDAKPTPVEQQQLEQVVPLKLRAELTNLDELKAKLERLQGLEAFIFDAGEMLVRGTRLRLELLVTPSRRSVSVNAVRNLAGEALYNIPPASGFAALAHSVGAELADVAQRVIFPKSEGGAA
jgi:hypothetical protein